MALPQIQQATFNLTLPSSKKKWKYRSFTVKEEKILLMALESKDEKAMVSAILQIIDNCTFGNIKNLSDLPFFDIEYMFIKMRQKSVGDTINATKRCTKCDEEIPIEIDLNKVQVDLKDKPNPLIEITENIGMELRYPSGDNLEMVNGDTDIDKMFNVVIHLIKSIYEGDVVHKPSDYTDEELMSFVESLPDTVFKKVNEFMANMPKTVYEATMPCPICNTVNVIRLEGLSSFF
jgi:hypothetical protein